MTWNNALQNRCYMCIQWTRVLYSGVLTRHSNPSISKFSRPCNEFTSVWSLFVYNTMNVSFVSQPILYVNLQSSLALHIGLVLSKSLSYLFHWWSIFTNDLRLTFVYILVYLVVARYIYIHFNPPDTVSICLVAETNRTKWHIYLNIVENKC